MRTRALAAAALFCLSLSVLAAPPAREQTQEESEAGSFTIVELGSSNALTLDAVQTSLVRIPLTIQGSEKDTANVLVRVTELVSTQGVVVVPDWTEKSIPLLKKGAQERLVLTVQLPIDGTYRATVRLVVANKVTNTGTIEVKRLHAEPPVEMPELNGRVITLGPLRDEKSVEFETTLYPSGQEVRLAPPYLHSFIRKEKSDSTTGVREQGSLTLLSPAPAPIVVPAGQQQPLRFRVTGIRHPGRYDAAIRFRTDDSSWVTRIATVYARDPWWLAAAYILLGIIAGLLLRAWGGTVRPRLVMKQRAAGLIQQLREHEGAAGDDAASLRLIRAIQANIRTRLGRTGQAGAATDLDIFPSLIAAAGMFTAIRKRLRDLPEPLRLTFDKQLDEPERALSDPATDAEGVKTQVTALTKTARDAERAVDIDERIRAVEDELSGDNRPELNEVRTALAGARTLLLEGKVVEAESALRDAARKYADNVVAALDTLTSGDSAGGVPKAEWAALQKDVATAKSQLAGTNDPQRARTIVDEVLTRYVTVMTHALANNVADAASNIADPNHYDEVTFALAAIRIKLAQGQILTAWSEFDAARKRYNELLPAGAGSPMGAADADAEETPAPSGAMFDLLTAIFPDRGSAADLFKPGAEEKITATLDRWDAVAALLIFVVATLTGLQVLWADNLTWGGWKSVLAAFLWGFAFNQFTHGGLVGLIKKE